MKQEWNDHIVWIPEEYLVYTARDKPPVRWHEVDKQEWDGVIAWKQIEAEEGTGSTLEE